MALARGSVIGPYQVLEAIGAGGMGEVYRARDTKLQRDVALKVLPDAFARDPERLARFEREARTLASLNHPHIAQVYGVEGRALVMELVDGEDLAERLTRAGPLPIEEALPIALQIAEALEAAHAQGIIHRDLKPANIKVRPDGTVKVLDFGLAKALDPAPGAPPVDPENSPTITSPFALSNLGVVLGTAAYMAPEQAKGQPLDKRVDVWAFGCVLYELLTGRRVFGAEDVTDTLAAIMRAEPDWDALPAGTPTAVGTLLRRCLVKDRRERLPDIGAARLELKDAQSTGSGVGAAAVVPARSPRRRAGLVPWVVAALALAAAVASMFYAATIRVAPPQPQLRLMIVPPAPLVGAPALRMAISPDGTRLVFAAPDSSGTTMLWVRPLDTTTAVPLPGTAHASAPFWSYDSRSIAFIADGKLRRISAAGGPVLTIATAINAPPGTWSKDDVIVFSGFRGPLARVSANGPDTPVKVTELTPGIGEKIQILPSFLPDGRHFLYTAGTGGSRSAGIYIGSLDSTKTELLLPTASNAAFANGYLLYLRDTTLVAQRFDPDARRLSGEGVPIATDVQINTSTGTGAFSVSRTGVLVYQSGVSSGTQFLWLDRAGKPLLPLSGRAGFQDIHLSPDDKTASATLVDEQGRQSDVWLFDLTRKGLTRRLTFNGGEAAVWSPDGRWLAYASRRNKKTHDIYRLSADGAGTEELLFADDADKFPIGFTPDGRTLLYQVMNGAATGHVWLLPLTGERKPQPFNQKGESETPAEVSPDGRWAAFVSDDGGRRDVFVTSFPSAAGLWQISTDGGDNPRWRRDGKELFYTGPDALYAVDVNTASAQFDFAAPRRLFDVRVPAPALGVRSTYAVTSDGQQFLFNMWDPKSGVTPITVVVNWTAALR